KERRREIAALSKKIQEDKLTRRVLEIQSDLFQKGRFVRETGQVRNTNPLQEEDIFRLINELCEQYRTSGMKDDSRIREELFRAMERQRELYDASKQLERLMPYRNTWQDRII